MKLMIIKECKWSISVDGYENSIVKKMLFQQMRNFHDLQKLIIEKST